jgi:c-di-GMP-binding flagellar brake protein YcgR
MTTPGVPEGFHPLHNRMERIAVLRRLRDERVFLACLLLDGGGQPLDDKLYQTLITSVDAQSDQLQVTPLDPAEGRAALRKGALLSCAAQLGRETVYFTTNWLKNVGLLTSRHVLALPRILYSSEARQAERVEIPEALPSRLVLQEGSNKVASGRVLDLSTGGLAGLVTVTEEMDYLLTPGVELQPCFLEIKGHLQLADWRLRLRLVRWRQQRDYLVGGEFVQLSPKAQREVEITVAKLERERLARLARLREEEGAQSTRQG